jgi:uncharacterized repeat protein (TIGR03803 family)
MRRWNLSHYAINSCVAAALLAGCGGSGAMPQSSAFDAHGDRSNYKVVYRFGPRPDGSNPKGRLLDVGGTLYGTTEYGGLYKCGSIPTDYYSCGTVFSITTGGTEKVLHRFAAQPDGDSPDAGLIDVGGTLYGTTRNGGSFYTGSVYTCGYETYFVYLGCGTVFSITPGGTEKVLHSFEASADDGAEPEAPLIEVRGTFYGTTDGGGAHRCGLYTGGCGTVFSITPGGTEKVLHSFNGRDGRLPVAGLIEAKGTLYGTTSGGGAYHCPVNYHDQRCGTVFSITRGGRAKVLHSFNGTDGKFPAADLLEVRGTFYGTTEEGGAYDFGTVFSITPGGTEKVLHSFNKTDGAYPVASLIEVKGTLYGTTRGGGMNGSGTVFSVTPDGTEQVVHSFGSGSDGVSPQASLIDVNGTLYGTTFLGGGGAFGLGTVFALKP